MDSLHQLMSLQEDCDGVCGAVHGDQWGVCWAAGAGAGSLVDVGVVRGEAVRGRGWEAEGPQVRGGGLANTFPSKGAP